ncbi:MAG: hypothetical protein MJZ99_01755 [Bacteroidales bacterium]|nr:hypothetical protein [Candidatus Colimorpha merdihippi]MCQ2281339.1 hypothetical protein [Bacteroidales bacterium]
MKKNIIKTIVFSLVLMGTLPSKGQQQKSPDMQSSSPIVTIFGDVGAGFNDSGLSNLGFNLDRAYLGYQYKLGTSWKAKVVYDMGKGDDNSLQRLGYVKNAEIGYRHGRWGVTMGLTSTTQFGVQEKFWGFRYVYKSMMDQCKWGSSADLGVTASYKAADWLSVDLAIFNGEGYKKVQADDQLQYALGATIQPVDGLTLRIYGDMKTYKDTVSQHNVALFAGYRTKMFRVGAEYNIQLNHGGSEGRRLQGMSLYGAVAAGELGEVYARYDRGDSFAEDAWQYGQNGQTAIVGYQYHANKLFSFSPNMRIHQAAGSDALSVYACVSMKVNL